MACAHSSLVLEWSKLFERIGIKNNIVKGSAKTRIGGVKGVKDSLIRFYEIGGFLEGVQVCLRRSPLCGFEKQKILRSAVEELKKYNRINKVSVSFEEFVGKLK